MAIYELRNDTVAIGLESLGAELKSLKRLGTGAEYMWRADPAFWDRTSPILFPFVGSVNGKEYRAKGRTYAMNQHGFARDMEFGLLSQSEDEIWFELRDNEETRKMYPYAFLLRLGYRLLSDGVEVKWQVENPGKEGLAFSIGGHPGFNCPLEGDIFQKTDYYLKFENIERFESTRVGDGLVIDEKGTYELEQGGYLAVTEHLFDCDTLVLEDYQTNAVSICRPDKSPYVTVTMENVPVWGIWTRSPKAPFICIEPWYGRCDRTGFSGDLAEREWGNMVRPGESFEASYKITVS
ncbi:MAG: aldose 1-epimerase family protein [Lachnospiraceae bacterium]|nr:aldose 1-epimerase family protein [Lachnospiraceae bacterium]